MPNTNPPMVRAAILMPFILHFEKRGGDVDLLLEDVNITKTIMKDTDQLVAVKAVYEIAFEIASRLGDPFVGAIVGREMAENTMEGLAAHMAEEHTVGDLLNRFLVSVRTYGNSTEYRLENDGRNVTLKMTRKVQPDINPTQPDALTLAFLVEQFRQTVGGAWNPRDLLAVVVDETVVPNWLLPSSSLITGSAMGLTLRFPAQWMMLSRRDQKGASLLGELPDPQKSLVEVIQDFCRGHMNDPKLDIAKTARACRLHPKALSRLLSREGTSFKEILNGQRRQYATSAIAESELSVANVALRSGFTHPSNFTRAYRRWTGQSPLEARAKQE